MGENPKHVFNVGCPSIDIIKKVNFKKKVDLSKYSHGLGYKLDLSKPYYVVLIHPVTTNYTKNLDLISTILKLINKLQDQIVWIWPNNDAGADLITKKIRSYREKNNNTKINFYTNLETEDYLNLIKNSKCLIGNSSSGIREGSYLAIPTVNIGNRQNLRERGNNVIDVEINSSKIIQAIKKITNKKIKKSKIYGNGNSIKKILKVLSSIKLDNKKNYFFK